MCEGRLAGQLWVRPHLPVEAMKAREVLKQGLELRILTPYIRAKMQHLPNVPLPPAHVLSH